MRKRKEDEELEKTEVVLDQEEQDNAQTDEVTEKKEEAPIAASADKDVVVPEINVPQAGVTPTTELIPGQIGGLMDKVNADAEAYKASTEAPAVGTVTPNAEAPAAPKKSILRGMQPVSTETPAAPAQPSTAEKSTFPSVYDGVTSSTHTQDLIQVPEVSQQTPAGVKANNEKIQNVVQGILNPYYTGGNSLQLTPEAEEEAPEEELTGREWLDSILPRREDYTANQDAVEEESDSIISPEEEAKRHKAAEQMNALSGLTNIANAFSNLAFAGKAPSQKLPETTDMDKTILAFRDKWEKARNDYKERYRKAVAADETSYQQAMRNYITAANNADKNALAKEKYQATMALQQERLRKAIADGDAAEANAAIKAMDEANYQLKLDLTNQYTRAKIGAANRSNTGGGGGSKSSSDVKSPKTVVDRTTGKKYNITSGTISEVADALGISRTKKIDTGKPNKKVVKGEDGGVNVVSEPVYKDKDKSTDELVAEIQAKLASNAPGSDEARRIMGK